VYRNICAKYGSKIPKVMENDGAKDVQIQADKQVMANRQDTEENSSDRFFIFDTLVEELMVMFFL